MRIQAKVKGVWRGVWQGCLLQVRRLENSFLRKWHFTRNWKDVSEGYVEFNKNRCALVKKDYFSSHIDQMCTVIHTGIILSVFKELDIANLVSAFANINKNVRITTKHSLSWNCYCHSKKMINLGWRVWWFSLLEDAKWCKDCVSKDYKARNACGFFFIF